MASVMRVQKSLVTRRANSIGEWIKETQHLLVIPPDPEKQHRAEELSLELKACDDNIDLMESSLHKLAQAYDNLEERTPEDDMQFDRYVESAHDVIAKLDSQRLQLKKAYQECMKVENSAPPTGQDSTVQRAQPSLLSLSKLPEIPIPTFSGRRWEWENYWALFVANVHQQDLTDLQKFNYLLSSLSGEARQSVAKFQVSASNYQKAIDYLAKRYGNKEGIVLELHKNLNRCTARGSRTEDQRHLLERLLAIAAQLRNNGEQLDNYLTVHTFLQKFQERIQKKAMKHCLRHDSQPTHQEEEYEWRLELWLQAIDSIISDEERIHDLLPREKERTIPRLPQNRETFTATCENCNLRGHKWSSCPKLPTPSARRTFLQTSNRCLNCGSNNHRVGSCPSGNCRKCQQKHHTSICSKDVGNWPRPEPKRTTPSTEQQKPSKPSQVQTPTKKTRSFKQHSVTARDKSPEHSDDQEAVVLQLQERPHDVRSKVILLVGSIRVSDSTNRIHEAEVLLDTGSELSFIQEDLARELALPITETTSLRINTFGTSASTAKNYDVSTLQTYDVEGKRHNLRLLRSDYITGTVDQAELDESDCEFIRRHGIALSLQKKTTAIQPKILLGCDYLWKFLMPIGKLTLPSGLHLIPTTIGYIISGRQPQKTSAPVRTLTIMNSDTERDTWDKYWSLESAGTNEYTGSLRTELQQTNKKILQDFRDTIQRRKDGYYVRLPWKTDSPLLPDNRHIALKRLYKILEMYSQKKEVLSQYDSIFKEQLENGIIEEVPQEAEEEDGIIHYLPHQAVITPAKETTKMRIVFDASAHYKDQPCLNDVLHQGPLLLPDMVSILLRFRVHNIAVIADVEKAFLQVRLQEIDRNATRCLWLRDISLPPNPDNIVTYRFTRVTFGLNTSPFLLGATISFHLDQLEDNSNYAKEIKENLYVDNLIIGATSTQEALHKYHLSKDIFNGLNMNLREFLSNSEEFNNAIASQDRTKAICPKVLGLRWNSTNDHLILQGTMTPAKIPTKRTVSMQLASVFDPLGLMVPVLLPAKVFLQSLWKDEYDWDTPLPPHLQEQWRCISSGIATFYKELDRKAVDYEDSTIFVFTDASQFAMATCVYLRTRTATHLVMAKSKLPSIKTAFTIPKLEMNALTLGVRVAHFIHSSLNHLVKIKEILFFTDSEIVLGWIKNPPNRQAVGVLVSNRLNEIRTIVNDLDKKGVITRFGYINTASNPADCATRGWTTASFKEYLWWNGPELIRKDITHTTEYESMFQLAVSENESIEEADSSTAAATMLTRRDQQIDEPTLFPLFRFNSFHKAQRVVAYVIRFIRKLVQHLPTTQKDRIFETISALKTATTKHEFTGLELRNAKKLIIRDHQKAMVDNHRLNSQKDLNIKPDEEDILRCYGRLQHATLPPSATTPIFIVPKTELARLIIQEAHSQYHLGVAHTMATVRETFWIPKLRQQVTRTLRRCIPCQKLNNPPFLYPNMKDLPQTRVQRSRPFEHIGLDYFGPLSISGKKEEGPKAYGCIFTCRTTRLLHLELVEDMSTEAFINALRRFFARRGVPQSITCDNAPTFLLGEQILFDTIQRMLQDEKVESAVARREIEWIHITPYAPWQGGFYERLIRSIKYSLYKALGKQTVSFDVLRTMLAEIEAVLNSRPLTYQEERWEQQPILRPIDFLQNEISLNFPLEYVNEGGDTTYHTPEEAQQLLTQRRVEAALKSSIMLTEKFWKIWSTQYLTNLREHHRLHMDNKRGKSTKPAVGDVVLLCDSVQPRNTWKIGRIIETRHTPSDVIREVVIELPNKRRVRRPVNNVVPLEIKSDTMTDQVDEEQTPESILPPRYNLRKRKAICYDEGRRLRSPSLTNDKSIPDSSNPPDPNPSPPQAIGSRGSFITRASYVLTIVLSVLAITDAAENATHNLQCIEGGVVLSQKLPHRYDICTENYCWTYLHPREKETVMFPAQVVLHKHQVKWKIFDGQAVDVLMTTCAAASFCDQIDCTFCVTIIANPECWPRTAIILTGAIIYMSITLCYFLFHVPVIIGNPVLYLIQLCGKMGILLAKAILTLLGKTILSVGRRICQRTHRRRRNRLWSDTAISLAIIFTAALACQEVDILDHKIRSCRIINAKEVCTIDTLEVVKINPFRQEACLRLTGNSTNFLEIKLLWNYLDLICEKETIMFTRSTTYGLLDSKRCPHTGSCIGQKCGTVNRSSHIPELERANHYPGISGCVESCGGPGCDCFYLSSGCLFYRIYLVPNDQLVYQIYRCARWKQTVDLQVTVTRGTKEPQTNNFRILPNQPRIIPPATVTLSSIAIPPTPLLNSRFITDGKRTTLVPTGYVPPLRCRSSEHAMNLTCEVVEDCTCSPAEVKMICNCKDVNLTAHMRNPEHQLPVLQPNLEFRMQKEDLIARIPQLPTAEFVIRIKEELRSTEMLSDAVCYVANAKCTGCYNCAKGARASVVCKSSTLDERAEIRCDDHTFTIPCSSQGVQSELRFTASRAQVNMNCSVQCGRVSRRFEIVGTLYYIGVLQTSLQRLLRGESQVHAEINLPDFRHIGNVFLQWSGTLFITAVILAGAIILTYICATNAACLLITRVVFRIILLVSRVFIKILLHVIIRLAHRLICTPIAMLWQMHKDYSTNSREKLL